MKKVKRLVIILSALVFWGVSSTVYAFNFDLEGVKFGINGYMDIQYTYMAKQTMSDGALMKDMSTFEQNQMNLIFDMEKDRVRTHLNLESHNAYTSEDGGKGGWEIENAFGQYTFSDMLVVRGGQMLTPFGIFNEVSYITPLFASVVLPMMYRLPDNYGEEHMMPDRSNVVIKGTYFGDVADVDYNFMVSNGDRGQKGHDENKDKGLGGRVRFTIRDNYKLGASYYTVNNDNLSKGRENLWGFDLEMTLLDERILFQGEYVKDEYEKRADKMSYYARLTYAIGDYTPFIMYDYFEDPDDLVMKNKLNRYGAGLSYDFDANIILKGEYHYHDFSGDIGLQKDTDMAHMFKMAAVFVF